VLLRPFRSVPSLRTSRVIVQSVSDKARVERASALSLSLSLSVFLSGCFLAIAGLKTAPARRTTTYARLMARIGVSRERERERKRDGTFGGKLEESRLRTAGRNEITYARCVSV